ncbi:hypothetical protein Purlil1_4042 [Purpureocillium lilacinum]|uniref:Uncharacterized protein n=1 Tax=Purpureocillium lilacinum TaxID=33203 RepID=A0ABR0C5I5_PURLI|nr:hypothetical protein Purlil1_4042 [Purpureocillium lilacinum]
MTTPGHSHTSRSTHTGLPPAPTKSSKTHSHPGTTHPTSEPGCTCSSHSSGATSHPGSTRSFTTKTGSAPAPTRTHPGSTRSTTKGGFSTAITRTWSAPQPTGNCAAAKGLCPSRDLPRACLELAPGPESDPPYGHELTPLLPACYQALGTAASFPSVATCLRPEKITDSTEGKDIVACLNRTLPQSCIQVLPQACQDLKGVDLGLHPIVDACVKSLGAFANDEILKCTQKEVASGDAILKCILHATGLPNPEDPYYCKPRRKCIQRLPRACDMRYERVFWRWDGDVKPCLNRLGWASSLVSHCVAGRKSGDRTDGKIVMQCIWDTVKDVCLEELPHSCRELPGVKAAQYAHAARQCHWDLGPFASSEVTRCLNAKKRTGQEAVECMNRRVFR